jgi:hypothetical protein
MHLITERQAASATICRGLHRPVLKPHISDPYVSIGMSTDRTASIRMNTGTLLGTDTTQIAPGDHSQDFSWSWSPWIAHCPPEISAHTDINLLVCYVGTHAHNAALPDIQDHIPLSTPLSNLAQGFPHGVPRVSKHDRKQEARNPQSGPRHYYVFNAV